MFARLLCLGLVILCAPPAHAGKSAPDYQLYDLEGELHRASDYRGRWLVINYWATWCAPCLHEMPELQRFYEDNADRAMLWGVTFEDEDRGAIVEFVERVGVTYPILGFGQDPRTGFGEVRVLPTTFVIDPRGVLHERFEGPIKAAHLQRAISGK